MNEPDNASDPAVGDEPQDPTTDESAPQRGARLSSFVRSRRGVAVIVVLGVLVIVGVVLGIPTSRYAVVGLVVKKDAHVAIVDSTTKKPLSGVRVAVEGAVATTNSKGVATLRALPVGPHAFTLAKQYYRGATGTVLVPITSAATTSRQRLVATGFPLTVTATDRISGTAIGGARIQFGSSQATTDDTGTASIVLPITTTAQTGTVTRDGYNAQTVSVDVAQRPSNVPVSLTGAGTLRYLSKATGVINVMQANLDGTDAKVVLAGTGSESDDSTTLLTTTDWRYSALLANRTGKRDALYLLADGKNPATIDAPAGGLLLIGWQEHTFFWQTYTDDSKVVTLQAFDADTGRKTVITTTTSTYGASNYISNAYLQHGKLVYGRNWEGFAVPAGSTSDLMVVDTATLTSKVVKSFPAGTNISIEPYLPERVYVRAGNGDATSFSSYSYSALTPVTITDDKFYSEFPTYLESPDDKQTLWAEPRDGKNTIFIGNEDGGDAKQLATLSEYTPYGWYGSDDRYILLTKNGSELYIAPAGVPLTTTNVLKVTDYHKPANTYPGYGSGYGG